MEKQELIGMTTEAAKRYCEEHGRVLRVVTMDDYPCIITHDMNADRINVAVRLNNSGQYVVTQIAGVY